MPPRWGPKGGGVRLLTSDDAPGSGGCRAPVERGLSGCTPASHMLSCPKARSCQNCLLTSGPRKAGEKPSAPLPAPTPRKLHSADCCSSFQTSLVKTGVTHPGEGSVRNMCLARSYCEKRAETKCNSGILTTPCSQVLPHRRPESSCMTSGTSRPLSGPHSPTCKIRFPGPDP